MMKQIRILIFCSLFGIGMLAFAFRSYHQNSAEIINGERYIAVIVPSYNNGKWCQKNLNSIFAQKYDNYHIFFIDDASSDHNFEIAQECVARSGKQNKITLIQNNERKGALHNLYTAIHALPDKAIVCTIDGDDWLTPGRTDVLTLINNAYGDPNVWLTYGQFETYNGPGRPAALGICHPMPEGIIKAKSYRKEEWFVSHLRTFYAGLFKKVKEEDLKLGGKFYSVAWDQAFLHPMLEMANGHIKFIDQIIYIYNQANPLNDFRQHLRTQLTYERIIRRKEPYEALPLAQAEQFIAS